jgi:hypothetical protein
VLLRQQRATWQPADDQLKFGSIFEATVGSAHGLHFWSGDESDETTVMRLAGSLILLLLPQPGLVEAFGELRDVWEFHCEQLALGAPTPSNEKIGNGRIVESVERPVLAVEG